MTPEIEQALDEVPERLRKARHRRKLTITDAATATGISKSTLSRLETGQRRPTLELLLLLAAVYRMALDDLVAAPETGDRRIRMRPRTVKERTVIPLSGEPEAVQAWKIVIPARLNEPKLRTHEGDEWLYVLSGKLRLIVAEEDMVLDAGDAMQFGTERPHWFGSTGDGPVEVISIFTRPGERIRLRGSERQAEH